MSQHDDELALERFLWRVFLVVVYGSAIAMVCALISVLTGCAAEHATDTAQPPVYLASDLGAEHVAAVVAAVQDSPNSAGCGWYVQYAQLDAVLETLRAADPCAVTVQLAPDMDASEVTALVREARP